MPHNCTWGKKTLKHKQTNKKTQQHTNIFESCQNLRSEALLSRGKKLRN